MNTMSFKEVQTKKTMNSHKRLRENRKRFCFFVFFLISIFAKHAIFASGVSRQQVARASRQNTQSQNYEKNF